MTFAPEYSDLAYSLSGYGKRRNQFDDRRQLAQKMILQGSDTSPVQSPWQGVGRLAQALAGGLDSYMTDRDEKTADKKRSDALAQAMAEPDPQKRIGLIAAYDPDTGARAAGQLAIEQAKQQAALKALKDGADGFGAGYGGQPPQQQASGGISAPTPLQPLPSGTIPPGGFANNSGNIRASSVNWEGQGAPQNGFATFNTPQAGANAQFKNFQAYVQANPTMTVAQALAKWAPPNENDTGGYISKISEESGVNPGMPMAEVLKDPMVAARLLDAQTRLEKGGLPQGFGADTFIAAAGGQGQPAPGVIPPGSIAQPPQGQPPQVAQGDGTPPQPNAAGVAGPAVVAPPAAPEVPRPQPSQQQIQQYQQRLRSGEFGVGPEAISKARAALDADLDRLWSVERERQSKTGDRQAEEYRFQRDQQAEAQRHARGLQDKKDNPQYTQEQNLAHTYATRLNNAIPQLEALARDPSKIPSWTEQMNAISPYYPEPLVSDKAKEFRRVAKDIMSATLRRESGASIHSDEYTTEAQKFIPQPGDSPEIVANKLAALKQAARSIAEGTGRPVESYNFFGAAPAAGAGAAPSQGGGLPPLPPGFRPLP